MTIRDMLDQIATGDIESAANMFAEIMAEKQAAMVGTAYEEVSQTMFKEGCDKTPYEKGKEEVKADEEDPTGEDQKKDDDSEDQEADEVQDNTQNFKKNVKESLDEGAFSSGKLKPSKEMIAASKKIPSKSTVRDRDEKGVYTSYRENGKEVRRVYEETLDEGRAQPADETAARELSLQASNHPSIEYFIKNHGSKIRNGSFDKEKIGKLYGYASQQAAKREGIKASPATHQLAGQMLADRHHEDATDWASNNPLKSKRNVKESTESLDEWTHNALIGKVLNKVGIMSQKTADRMGKSPLPSPVAAGLHAKSGIGFDDADEPETPKLDNLSAGKDSKSCSTGGMCDSGPAKIAGEIHQTATSFADRISAAHRAKFKNNPYLS